MLTLNNSNSILCQWQCHSNITFRSLYLWTPPSLRLGLCRSRTPVYLDYDRKGSALLTPPWINCCACHRWARLYRRVQAVPNLSVDIFERTKGRPHLFSATIGSWRSYRFKIKIGRITVVNAGNVDDDKALWVLTSLTSTCMGSKSLGRTVSFVLTFYNRHII